MVSGCVACHLCAGQLADSRMGLVWSLGKASSLVVSEKSDCLLVTPEQNVVCLREKEKLLTKL